jgi:hypothetical protein
MGLNKIKTPRFITTCLSDILSRPPERPSDQQRSTNKQGVLATSKPRKHRTCIKVIFSTNESTYWQRLGTKYQTIDQTLESPGIRPLLGAESLYFQVNVGHKSLQVAGKL